MIRFYRLVFIIIFILFTGCSFVASRFIPINDIKSPTGEYHIGTQTFYWVDEKRDEWFTPDIEDNRRLMVQVWYPTTYSNSETYSWLDYSSDRVESLSENFKLPEFLVRSIDRVDTDIYIEATPIRDKIFPIVIFSHGFEGFRFQNMTQIQELVSHGYIVFAVDHTYDATLTIFPDGTQIPRAKKYCPNCKGDDFWKVFRPQIDTRIADIIFILNQIEKMKDKRIKTNFSEALDLDRIGIFGHSFGGGTSLAVSILDSRIKSCLSLDGWYVPVYPEIYNQELIQPFLHLGQTKWDEELNYQILDNILKSNNNIGYKLSLDGAHHYDFTDSPHLSSLASQFNLSSKIDSEEILGVTNTAVLGFFDTHLKLTANNWLEKIKSNKNTIVEKFNSKDE